MNRWVEALWIVSMGTLGAGIGVANRAYPHFRWEPTQWAGCGVIGAGLGVVLAVAALLVASEAPRWRVWLRGDTAALPPDPSHGREIGGVDELVSVVRGGER